MVKRYTSVQGDSDLMDQIKSMGYNFTDAFSMGLEILAGVHGKSLETLKKDCDEIAGEISFLQSK
jgi:hypothetical protein